MSPVRYLLPVLAFAVLAAPAAARRELRSASFAGGVDGTVLVSGVDSRVLDAGDGEDCFGTVRAAVGRPDRGPIGLGANLGAIDCGQELAGTSLSSGPTGLAVMTWTSGFSSKVNAAIRDPRSSSFGPASAVTEIPGGVDSVGGIESLAGTSGVLVAWTQPGPHGVMVAAHRRAGGWSAPVQLPIPAVPSNARLVGNGTTAVMVQEFENPDGTYSLSVSRGDFTGAFGPGRTLPVGRMRLEAAAVDRNGVLSLALFDPTAHRLRVRTLASSGRTSAERSFLISGVVENASLVAAGSGVVAIAYGTGSGVSADDVRGTYVARVAHPAGAPVRVQDTYGAAPSVLARSDGTLAVVLGAEGGVYATTAAPSAPVRRPVRVSGACFPGADALGATTAAENTFTAQAISVAPGRTVAAFATSHRFHAVSLTRAVTHPAHGVPLRVCNITSRRAAFVPGRARTTLGIVVSRPATLKVVARRIGGHHPAAIALRGLTGVTPFSGGELVWSGRRGKRSVPPGRYRITVKARAGRSVAYRSIVVRILAG